MRPYTRLPHRAAGFCTVAVLLLSSLVGRAVVDNMPVGSTFTYQGRLTDGGQPAEGTADLVFRLFGTVDGERLQFVRHDQKQPLRCAGIALLQA